MNITKIILWNQENSWNYYRDEISYIDVDDSVSDGKSLEHKTKIVGETPEGPPQPGNPRNTEHKQHQCHPKMQKVLFYSNILAIFGDVLNFEL